MNEPTPNNQPNETTMTDLSALVQASLSAAVTPELVRAKVDQHVDKLVDDAIRDALNSWSDTGKTIKAAVSASLRVNNLDLPSYGHVLTQMLERQIQARVSEVVAAKLSADVADLLSIAPKRVKLSELVADYLRDADERIYCKVEWSEYQSVTVTLSPDENPDRYSMRDAVSFMVSLDKKKYTGGEIPAGTIFAGTVKGTDLKRDIRFGFGTDHAKQGVEFGRWYGLEQKVLAMYACGTIIEIDEDSVVTERDY